MTTQGFTKIIRPFSIALGRRSCPVFCKIQWRGGKLSLTGVEGPLRNGDALGSAGQIIMHEWTPQHYAAGWDAESVARLREVWERWHMNDMNALSPEMRAAGWDEQAKVPVYKFEFELIPALMAEAAATRRVAIEALKAGETFTPTAEQVAAVNREFWVSVWCDSDTPPAPPEGYQRRASSACSRPRPPERKTLGWVRPDEHPDGLLGRKLHPEDSHGYGQKGWREDVPRDVLQWLEALPDADKRPAWV